MSTTRQATKVYIVAYGELTQSKLTEMLWRDPEAATGRLFSGVEEVQVGLRDGRESLVTG